MDPVSAAAIAVTAVKGAVVLIPLLCKGIKLVIERLSSKERPLMRLLQLCAVANELSKQEFKQPAQTTLDEIARVLGEVNGHLVGIESDPKIQKKWQGWSKRSVVERYVENLQTLIDDFIKLQKLQIPTPPLWTQFIHQPALLDWLPKVSLFKGFEEPTANFKRSLTSLPKERNLVSDFVDELSQGSQTISIELLAALNQFNQRDLKSLMNALIERGAVAEWMCMVCAYEHNTDDTCGVCRNVRGKSRIKLTLFLGNLGVGKSTLANLLLAEYSLRFGSAYGVDSVTQRFEFAPGKDGWFIGDTPGLDEKTAQDFDIQRVALQIELALSDSVGLHRLCFVIHPRGGRLERADVWTLKTIIQALNAPEYYVIVNQVNPRLWNAQYEAAFANKLMVALSENKTVEPPQEILYVPACSTAEGFAYAQSRLVSFVNRIPGQPLLAKDPRASQPTLQFQGQIPAVNDNPSNDQIERAQEIESEAKRQAEAERSKNEKMARKLNKDLRSSLANIVKRRHADDPRARAAAGLLADLNNDGIIPNQDAASRCCSLKKFREKFKSLWREVLIVVLAVALCLALCRGTFF